MTETFRCGDHEALVAYLYDESAPSERGQVAAHLARCQACADEVAALGATRARLASWAPPAAALGFRLPAGETGGADGAAAATAVVPLAPRRWWREPLPAWAQAAAAGLIFAAGLSIGSTRQDAPAPGPAAPAVETAAATAVAPVAAAPVAAAAAADRPVASVSPDDLARLEAALRAEIARTAAAPARTASDEPAVLARIERLIAESEERQRREFAMRTLEVVRDFDMQRRIDFAQFEQVIGAMQGATGRELKQHRDAWESLVRAASLNGSR